MNTSLFPEGKKIGRGGCKTCFYWSEHFPLPHLGRVETQLVIRQLLDAHEVLQQRRLFSQNMSSLVFTSHENYSSYSASEHVMVLEWAGFAAPLSTPYKSPLSPICIYYYFTLL